MGVELITFVTNLGMINIYVYCWEVCTRVNNVLWLLTVYILCN